MLIDLSQANNSRTPEDEIMEKQRMKLLRCAVSQLPEKYRKVVELRYYDELSYEEIADELCLSLSNVKIQLLRAKNMLHEIVGNVRNSL